MKRLCLLLLALLASPASATHFHADTDSALTYANAEAAAGDSVLLTSGYFTPSIAPASDSVTYIGIMSAPDTSWVDAIDLAGRSGVYVQRVGAISMDLTGANYCHVDSAVVVGPIDPTGRVTIDGGAHGNAIEDCLFDLTNNTEAAFYIGVCDSNYFYRNHADIRFVGEGRGVQVSGATGNTFADNRWDLSNITSGTSETTIYGLLVQNGSSHNTWSRDSFITPFSTIAKASIALGGYCEVCPEQRYNTLSDCFIENYGPVGMNYSTMGYNLSGNVIKSGYPLSLYSDSLTFRHNTVMGFENTPVLDMPAASITHAKVRSNIFYSEMSSTGLVLVWGTQSRFDSDSNLVYSGYEDTTRAFEGTGQVQSPPGGGDWTAAGNDSHSVWISPDFTDQGSWSATGTVPQNGLLFADTWADGYVGALDSVNVAANTYAVTIQTVAHGTTSRYLDKAAYSVGEKVILTSHPATGWHFTKFAYTGHGDDSTSTNTDGTDTLTVGSQAISVYTTFAVDGIDFHYTASANGHLRVNSTNVVAADTILTVPYGSYSDTVTASPDPGYMFAQWRGDLGSDSSRIDGPATAALHDTADFVVSYSGTVHHVFTDANLTTANAAAVAGDVVWVHAGTYTVGINPANAGEPWGQITYRGSIAHPESATVASVNFTGKSYISVKGLTVSGSITMDASNASVVAWHDSLLYVTGLGAMSMSGAHYCYVRRCTIGNDTPGDLFTVDIAFSRSTMYSTVDSSTFNLSALNPNPARRLRSMKSCTFTRNVWNMHNPSTNAADVQMSLGHQLWNNTFTDERTVLRNNNSAQGEDYGFHLRDSCRFNSWVRDTFTIHASSTVPVKIRFASGGSYPHWLVAGDYLGSCAYNNWTDCWFKADGAVGMAERSHGYRFVGNTFVLKEGLHLLADSLVFRHNTVANTATPEAKMGYQGEIVRSWIAHNIFYGTGLPASGVVWGDSAVSVVQDSNLVYSSGLDSTRAVGVFNGGNWEGSKVRSGGVACDDYAHECNSRWFPPGFIDSTWAVARMVPMNPLAYSSSLWGADGYVGAVEASAATGARTLVMANDGHGSSVKSPASAWHMPGETVTLTATPYYGYNFLDWRFSSGRANSSSNPHSYVVGAQSDTAKAYFIASNFPVHYHCGPNGSLVGDTAQSVAYLASGTQVRAVADSGYLFAGWSDGYRDSARTEYVVTDTVDVTATFASSANLAVYIHPTPTGWGTVAKSPDNAYYTYGTVVRLTATAASGYEFDYWIYGSTRIYSNPLDISVTGTAYIYGVFKKRHYTLTYSAATRGTISGTNPQSVEYLGSGTPVTAVPNAGWAFSIWSDRLKTATRTDRRVAEDRSPQATFLPLDTYCTLHYKTSAGGVVFPLRDTLQYILCGTAGKTMFAVPDSAHTFARWVSALGETSTVFMRRDVPNASDTYTAEFAVKTFWYRYIVQAGGVLVSGSVLQTINYGANGTQVVVAARPGYHFDGWSDGWTQLQRTDGPATSSQTFTALFVSVTVPTTPAVRSRTPRKRISDCVP